MFLDKHKYIKSLDKFRKQYIKGNIVSTKKYQKSILSSILKYMITDLKKTPLPKLKTEFKDIFIFLPSNIPLTAFQLMPLIISYDLNAYFKLPSRDESFFPSFLDILNSKKITAKYLTHSQSIKTAKKFDFIIGAGKSKLFDILKSIGKPFKFFGPKFSVAILKKFQENDTKKIIKDFLSFDTEGCLSVRFLFTFERLDFKYLNSIIKKQSIEYHPQESFNPFAYEYYNNINIFYSNKSIKNKSEAIFSVNNLPEFYPQRTLFIKTVSSYEEIINFLSEANDSVQGIINKKGKPIQKLNENTSVSIFLSFGKSQFPPVDWLFEKNLNIKNFFK